jgi:hypothetical protein
MPRAPRQNEPASLRRDRERFTALKAQLAELDFFVRGSLVHLRVRCGKRSCACATDPDARHGPYVRWTRKVAGRTVSTPLRSDEVPLFEQWLANSRRLDDLVGQMHALGLRAAARALKARTKI